MRAASRLRVLALAAALIPPAASCAQASRVGSTPATTPTSTALASSPGNRDVLAGCPATTTMAGTTVLARIGGDDDDIAVTAGGDIWLSQPHAGRLFELDSSGTVLRTIADPEAPEGIVVVPDGRLLVAEQRINAVVALDPATGSRTPFATIPGHGGIDVGIDGLGVDRLGSRLLVPDSPAGTLLALPLGGGPAQTLGSGLGRPVSAAQGDGGAVLVAEENLPGLVRVDARGSVAPLVAGGRLRSLDEVVVSPHGVAYVADLAAGTVNAVDPRDGRVHVLVTGAPSPQGLAVQSDGQLLVTDSTLSILVRVEGCR